MANPLGYEVAMKLLSTCGAITIAVLSSCQSVAPPNYVASVDPRATSSPTATFYGNSTLLIRDGENAVMIDGFVSRPSVARVLLSSIKADEEKVRSFLKEAKLRKLDAVFAAHSHYDHVMDAPLVAQLTGAKLVGSESSLNVGRGRLTDKQMIELDHCAPHKQKPLKFGKFTVRTLPADHAKYGCHLLDKATGGHIPHGFEAPAHALSYKEGGCFTFHFQHPQGSCLVHASAHARKDHLRHLPEGVTADVVFLAIALFEKMEPAREKQRAYWQEIVNARAPKGRTQIVVPIHWDNLFRPLDKPLKPMKSVKYFNKFLEENEDIILPNTKVMWMDKFSSLSIDLRRKKS